MIYFFIIIRIFIYINRIKLKMIYFHILLILIKDKKKYLFNNFFFFFFCLFKYFTIYNCHFHIYLYDILKY